MEASETTTDEVEGAETVVGDSGLDRQEQEPIGSDATGTVTPSSAPPAAAQSGDPLDGPTKAALGLGGQVPASGGPTPTK